MKIFFYKKIIKVSKSLGKNYGKTNQSNIKNIRPPEIARTHSEKIYGNVLWDVKN
jgi:hypothetical protein